MQRKLDKAGKLYWDRAWAGQSIPGAVSPRLSGYKNYVYRCFHEYFGHLFAGQETGKQHLLEIGCARSRWLPYFAREFGFRISGIDYSEIGCDQARTILEQAGVDGEIVHADFYAPPEYMLGAFDVVVSFGVVEHFEDTAACVAALGKFLKPGGLMITNIPNMVGGIGWLQKHLCRSIYDVHMPLDRRALLSAHQRAKLSVQSCKYFLGVHWGVANLTCWSNSYLYPIIRLLPFGLSIPFWFFEEKGLRIKPNRFTSPYMICAARK